MKQLNVPQSGSQQAITASRNRFGQYLRARATPVQPRTTFQVNVRAHLAAGSRAWAGLTDEQRAAWSSYASTHPRTDSLGQVQTLTGHQTFAGQFTLYSQLGLTPPDLPPSGDNPPAPASLTIVAQADTQSLTLASTVTPATAKVAFYVSPQLSPGVSFNGDYRLIGHVTAVGGAASLDAGDAYVARFGSLIAGRKIFAKAVAIDDSVDSQASTPILNTKIVDSGV